MNTASAGNLGDKIRSDCFITITLTESGGRDIIIESKVNSLYGKSIRELIIESLDFFEIENCELHIIDMGALPFVIMARIEAVVRSLTQNNKELLPEMLSCNNYSTEREQFRFSRLYLPGNSPSMMINAGIHKPNGIIFDLEDSVAPGKKTEALLLIRNALRALNIYGAERMVRINQGQKGLDELIYLIPHNVNLLLIPKCESSGYIKELDRVIGEIKQNLNINNPVWYMPIIESAKGVEEAYNIACSSKNVVAMAIGLEDFTADLGTKRTLEGTESFYARTRLINACKAAGIQPIDSVFSDVGDMEALKNNVIQSKSLGFEGMGCIHPRQISVIHDNFAPEPDEIEKALKIVEAFKEAEQKGLGVVSIGTKMIDPPVVKRALKTINLAEKMGRIKSDSLKN